MIVSDLLHIFSDLNPIEYVWKDIKHSVRNQNTDQTAQMAAKLAEKIMIDYSSDQWKRLVDHVKRYIIYKVV